MKYIVDAAGETFEVVVDGEAIFVNGERVEVSVAEVPGTPVLRLAVDGVQHALVIENGARRGEFVVLTDSGRLLVSAVDERTEAIRRLTGSRTGRSRHASLNAPMPGLILRVEVEVGQAIEAGQGLVVMEAMKMENELRASAAGSVRAIHVQPGVAVEKGTTLVEIDPPASVDSV